MVPVPRSPQSRGRQACQKAARQSVGTMVELCGDSSLPSCLPCEMGVFSVVPLPRFRMLCPIPLLGRNSQFQFWDFPAVLFMLDIGQGPKLSGRPVWSGSLSAPGQRVCHRQEMGMRTSRNKEAVWLGASVGAHLCREPFLASPTCGGCCGSRGWGTRWIAW